jgi:hypothetical protein
MVILQGNLRHEVCDMSQDIVRNIQVGKLLLINFSKCKQVCIDLYSY